MPVNAFQTKSQRPRPLGVHCLEVKVQSEQWAKCPAVDVVKPLWRAAQIVEERISWAFDEET